MRWNISRAAHNFFYNTITTHFNSCCQETRASQSPINFLPFFLHAFQSEPVGIRGTGFTDWMPLQSPVKSVKPLHTHTRLTALYPGLPGWAGTRKVKPTWILLKQETVSGSEIRWATCKSAAPCSRQITKPAPHRSVFYRPDALPAAQPTASQHWRQQRQSTEGRCQTTKWNKYDITGNV